MSTKTVTLIGATGLIGHHLLLLLLDDPLIDTVRILIRRPIDLQQPKLEKKIVDFNDADSLLVAIDNSDIVFCTIGTTQRKVKGNKNAFRKVDYDIPVNAARFCKITGCEKFIFVSSVGANHKSNNFYLNLKGEVEDAVESAGISSVHIMRPSLLLDDRKESRPLEKIGKKIMAGISFLLASKYKPIHGKFVAKAMLEASKKKETGNFVYEFREMIELNKLS